MRDGSLLRNVGKHHNNAVPCMHLLLMMPAVCGLQLLFRLNPHPNTHAHCAQDLPRDELLRVLGAQPVAPAASARSSSAQGGQVRHHAASAGGFMRQVATRVSGAAAKARGAAGKLHRAVAAPLRAALRR
jgi:hypothetical protein